MTTLKDLFNLDPWDDMMDYEESGAAEHQRIHHEPLNYRLENLRSQMRRENCRYSPAAKSSEWIMMKLREGQCMEESEARLRQQGQAERGLIRIPRAEEL